MEKINAGYKRRRTWNIYTKLLKKCTLWRNSFKLLVMKSRSVSLSKPWLFVLERQKSLNCFLGLARLKQDDGFAYTVKTRHVRTDWWFKKRLAEICHFNTQQYKNLPRQARAKKVLFLNVRELQLNHDKHFKPGAWLWDWKFTSQENSS